MPNKKIELDIPTQNLSLNLSKFYSFNNFPILCNDLIFATPVDFKIWYLPNLLTQFQRKVVAEEFIEAEKILNSGSENDFYDEVACVTFETCSIKLYHTWLVSLLKLDHSKIFKSVSLDNPNFESNQKINELIQEISVIANKLEYNQIEILTETLQIDDGIKLFIFYKYLENRSLEEANRIVDVENREVREECLRGCF